MIGYGCLMAAMIVATVTDVWRQKIFNWTTYPGMIVALGLAAWATMSQRQGITDLVFMESLMGFVACGAIMLVCFVFFQIGGGDVKLLAMVGAFLGVEKGIEVLLWTFVIGGASAVIILIWKFGAIALATRMFKQVMYKLQLGSFDSLTEEEQTQLQVPMYLAPSAFAAVVIVVFFRT